MPLTVKCKVCEHTILFLSAEDFDKFDPFSLPKKCPNCNRKLNNISNMNWEIYKYQPLQNKNNYNYIKYNGKTVEYRLSKVSYYRFKTLKKNVCDYCKKELKPGDKVISRRIGHYRYLYHVQCHEKINATIIQLKLARGRLIAK